jgi:transcription-repair coupling factor (superfamily II helicase)
VEMIDRFGLLPDPLKRLFAAAELKLQATALGIAKIDVGANGGRVKFVEKPSVDPMAIISLVQSQPKSYRMDGPDTLRLTLELPSPEERLHAVRGLVALLAPAGR